MSISAKLPPKGGMWNGKSITSTRRSRHDYSNDHEHPGNDTRISRTLALHQSPQAKIPQIWLGYPNRGSAGWSSVQRMRNGNNRCVRSLHLPLLVREVQEERAPGADSSCEPSRLTVTRPADVRIPRSLDGIFYFRIRKTYCHNQ